jgi:hypothetical protein
MSIYTTITAAHAPPTGYRVVLYTQAYEDGRCKGGGEWVIATPSLEDLIDLANQPGGIHAAYDALAKDAAQLLPSDPSWTETPLNWVILHPGELAADEADQRKYGGRVTDPAKDLFLWRHITDKASRAEAA